MRLRSTRLRLVSVAQRRVEFAAREHLADIGGRRNLVHRDAWRRLEAGGAAMAAFRRRAP